ncbi:hypothetical protein D3C83_67000 [compost metagenome]
MQHADDPEIEEADATVLEQHEVAAVHVAVKEIRDEQALEPGANAGEEALLAVEAARLHRGGVGDAPASKAFHREDTRSR